MEVILRFKGVISWNSGTVGTVVAQVSGQTTSALTAVSSSFFPNYGRQGVTITNTSAAATLYVGVSNLVTSSFYIRQIAPGDDWPILCDGSVALWLIASAAGTSFSLVEWK